LLLSFSEVAGVHLDGGDVAYEQILLFRKLHAWPKSQGIGKARWERIWEEFFCFGPTKTSANTITIPARQLVPMPKSSGIHRLGLTAC
jgi:hypothetical protein